MSKAKPMAAMMTMSHMVRVKRCGSGVTVASADTGRFPWSHGWPRQGRAPGMILRLRGDDFEQFDGGLVVAVDQGQAAERGAGGVQAEPAHQRRGRHDAQELRRLDPTQDVVV